MSQEMQIICRKSRILSVKLYARTKIVCMLPLSNSKLIDSRRLWIKKEILLSSLIKIQKKKMDALVHYFLVQLELPVTRSFQLEGGLLSLQLKK